MSRLRTNLNFNLNKSASPSPISDRVSGRLAPRSPPHAYFNFNLNLKDPAPLSPNSYLLSPVKLHARAFSLTEVVVALGIFAVSMVGVLALFPVASATGRESSEETQAAILAQTIFSDLRASASRRGANNAYLIRGTDTSKDFIDNIGLRTNGEYVIAYDIKVRDRADSKGGSPQIGPPIALKALVDSTSAAYTSGVTNLPTARYLARVQVRPDALTPSLASVIVQVSLPPDQPLTNRRTFTFPSRVFGP